MTGREGENRVSDHERRISHLETLEPMMVPGDLPFAVPAITLGLANAEGVADFVIRSDAVLQAGVPVNIGIVNAAGAATDFVRRDHVHNHPAGLGAPLHHDPVTLGALLAANLLSIAVQDITLDVQLANRIFAGPAAGGPAAPAFRAIVAADLPVLGSHWTKLGADMHPTVLADEIGLGIALPLTHLHLYEDTASTTPAVRIEQDGAGDAALGYLLTGGQAWSHGIDNSIAGDPFVLSAAANLNTPVFTVHPTTRDLSFPVDYGLRWGTFGSEDVQLYGTANRIRIIDPTTATNAVALWIGNASVENDCSIRLHGWTGAVSTSIEMINDGANSIFQGGANVVGFRVRLNGDVATSHLAITTTGSGLNRVNPATNWHIYEDNADTEPAVRIEQDGAGDAAIQWDVPTTIWSAGIDNSDLDKFKIARGANLNTDTRLTILQGGEVGIETDAPTGQLHVFQSDNVGALPVLELFQADQSEGFTNFVGNLAASAVGPLSTWTTGNSIQGFRRIEINGTPYWAPFYDAPTGP